MFQTVEMCSTPLIIHPFVCIHYTRVSPAVRPVRPSLRPAAPWPQGGGADSTLEESTVNVIVMESVLGAVWRDTGGLLIPGG